MKILDRRIASAVQAAREGTVFMSAHSKHTNITSRDMYYAFLDEANGDRIAALLAYSYFERDRYAWIEAREQVTNSSVNSERVAEWITDYDRDRALKEARDTLDLKNALANQSEQLISVQAHLMRIPSARQDFAVGVVTGITANFVFVLIALAFTLIFVTDPSPIFALKALIGGH